MATKGRGKREMKPAQTDEEAQLAAIADDKSELNELHNEVVAHDDQPPSHDNNNNISTAIVDLSDFSLKPGVPCSYENGKQKGTFTNFAFENSKDKPLFLNAFNVEFYVKATDGVLLFVTPTEKEHFAFKQNLDNLYDRLAEQASLPKGMNFRDHYSPILTQRIDTEHESYTSFFKFTKSPRIVSPTGANLTLEDVAGKRGRACVTVMIQGLYLQPSGKNTSCYIRKMLIKLDVINFTDSTRDDHFTGYKRQKQLEASSLPPVEASSVSPPTL